MASNHVVEEIKQRIDLAEYIGRSVDLKRAGRTFKACCPFHVEKTPSFVVFPHTGTWHCFGACGEGGDIFSFLQKREGLDFSEALEQLAREAGVQLEEESELQREARERRETLRALCEAAAQQFQEWLRDLPAAQACRAYVERRGIDAEMQHRFGLGYAPNAWDQLLGVLGARGYLPEDMAAVGLVRARDGGGYYDAFRDRLIFPIRDTRGRVIGFGGRALHEEQLPKYINSPQSPLFDKSRTLYGLDLAKDTIRGDGRAVLVEGYMDVIAAQQAGFSNVVAALGTALTSEQLRLLYRYATNLVLALDADEAGQRAAERGLDAVMTLQRERRQARWEKARQGQGRAAGVEGDVRVMLLPEGYDPDDLIREQPERWRDLVAASEPLMDYLITRRLRAVNPDEPVQKAQAAADLLPLIAELDSTLVRDHYLQRLARLLHADERTLARQMVKLAGTPRPARPRPAAPADERPARTSPRDGKMPSPSEHPVELPPPALPGWEEATFAPDEWLDEDGAPPDYLPLPPDDVFLDAPPSESEPALLLEGTTSALEAYLLYLLLEQPAWIDRAVEEGVRADMWQQTTHRQLWEALRRERPESGTHLEEFAAELEPAIGEQVRRIVHSFSATPPIEREEWSDEAFSTLQEFLIRHEDRQARQLHFLLDDLQRTLEPDPQALRELLLQKIQLERSKLRRQRLLRERARVRKLAHPTRP